jgi:hypothetical protein
LLKKREMISHGYFYVKSIKKSPFYENTPKHLLKSANGCNFYTNGCTYLIIILVLPRIV